MKIADMIERGRALALMPICRRFEDNSVEVVGPLPPAPEPAPVRLRAEAAVLAGYGAWSGFSLPRAASAPFVEIEAGARVHTWSVVGFAGYVQVERAAARDSVTDGGLKLRFHNGPLGAGLGAGVEQLHDVAISTRTGPRDDMHELGLVEGDLGYTAVARDQFSVRLLAIASGALGGSGTMFSARVALSVGR